MRGYTRGVGEQCDFFDSGFDRFIGVSNITAC